jgi:hypothetical protein
MAVKITLDQAALDHIADLFTRAGNAAQAVGAALPTDREVKRARRAVRSRSAWSFASLLDRLFGRSLATTP